MEDFDKTNRTGLSLYNQWYNEQPSRIFQKKDKAMSLDSCFQIINKTIVEDPAFIKWAAKYQKGQVIYIPGSQAASVLPVNDLTLNYLKPCLGLPFYRVGGLKSWTTLKDPLLQEIGLFANADKYDRYLVIRSMMIKALIPIFQKSKFKNDIINAIITAYHSETRMEVFIHNDYIDFGEQFIGTGTFSSVGKPASTAFGLGQWLGGRLLDLFYYANEKLSIIRDPRVIGPEFLYHPSIHVGFMANELKKGSWYHTKIMSTLNKWEKNGTLPSYSDFVSLVLTIYQGIPSDDKKQFKIKEKIQSEKLLVNGLNTNKSSFQDRLTIIT